MDNLWGLALSNMTAKVIVILVFVILILVGYLVLVKYGSLFYKKKAFKTPGLSKRFLAFILDYVALNLTFYFLTVLILLCIPDSKNLLNDYAKERFANDWALLKYDFKYTQYLLLAFYCFYSLVCELSPWGGTLAMNRTDLKVVNLRGEKPKPVQLFTRNLVKYGVILYWPFFVLLTFTNRNRRWIHEIVSRTKVVEV